MREQGHPGQLRLEMRTVEAKPRNLVSTLLVGQHYPDASFLSVQKVSQCLVGHQKGIQMIPQRP